MPPSRVWLSWKLPSPKSSQNLRTPLHVPLVVGVTELSVVLTWSTFRVTKDGNFWVEGEKFEFFEFDISEAEQEAACARIKTREDAARNKKRKYIAQ